MKWLISSLALLVAAPVSNHGDILHWADCPPGVAYDDPSQARYAHFQTSPVAGPSGGTCSLEVVTGAVFNPGNTAGGVAFETAAEVANTTYTLAFDFQWVHGDDDWFFANEEGDGLVNGLSFQIPYPGDRCWHRFVYTAPLGKVGPRSVLFVYQGKTKKNQAPVLEEMRIDNMTLSPAEPHARMGLSEEPYRDYGDRECRREWRGYE